MNKTRFEKTMPGSDSDMKKATEALKRENEWLEAEKRRQDKEHADLLKRIKETK